MKKNPLIITCLVIVGICVCLGVISQAIISTRAHTNPPVIGEPIWDSPATRQLAQRACFDCHSNETAWPWYTNVPPFSYLVLNDVREGREHLNFSEWGVIPEDHEDHEDHLEEIGEVILEGEMPPRQYLLMHPEARLSSEEKNALARGLQTTAANNR
jgi:hypothetical protein